MWSSLFQECLKQRVKFLTLFKVYMHSTPCTHTPFKHHSHSIHTSLTHHSHTTHTQLTHNSHTTLNSLTTHPPFTHQSFITHTPFSPLCQTSPLSHLLTYSNIPLFALSMSFENRHQLARIGSSCRRLIHWRRNRKKRRQRSSLLFGGRNSLNSLPHYRFRAPGWFEEKTE